MANTATGFVGSILEFSAISLDQNVLRSSAANALSRGVKRLSCRHKQALRSGVRGSNFRTSTDTPPACRFSPRLHLTRVDLWKMLDSSMTRGCSLPVIPVFNIENMSSHPTLATPESLESLREAFAAKPPFVSGTLPLDPKNFILFHGAVKNAHCIDLAHASEEDLQILTNACDRATFGLNKEDVLDESYRKAGKLDSSSFSTSIVPERTSLIDLVRAGLLEGMDATRPIKVELYKLNVYDEGSFFKPHQDTPRSESMFGSLVLVFPTPHKGGALVLRDDEKEWTFDSAAALTGHAGDTPSIGYVAFFSDVEHEVLPVESGHRLTITFNLYFGDIETTGDTTALSSSEASVSPTIPPNEILFKTAFQTLLEDPAFLPDGGTLAFGMHHVYPIKDSLKHIPKLLKGNDALVWRVSKQLGVKPRVYVLYKDGRLTALVPTVPNFKGYCDQEDISLAEQLHRTYHAMVLLDDVKRIDTAERVNWVTGMKVLSRVKSPYMAYGNQAELSYAYGDVCLIVRLGRPGSRGELVARPKKKAHYGFY
ncbi:hypothetical protein EVG20_g5823 [Dentipellis fragilis]|uniref:Fe2OG dioxygenase domain-containing protein n=1 Tax=Dentipellis fragilis TaxID=205917 RepID=A0A4Y9YR07_9AGAM|nr:hypothetical protein EVG20_g5823 [Dentipellis fragilis]